MAENNSIQEGGILTLDRNAPGEFVVAGGNLKDGWKVSETNLVVPDSGIKVERNGEIPQGIGVAGLTAETDDTGIFKAVQNIIRDPGEFKVKTDEQKVEVLKTDLTKASRAMYNPGQYIANSLESHGEGDLFKTERVTKSIFERVEKSRQYFDKYSGKTETLVSTGPGLMEKYLIEAVNCVGDHGLVSSEAPKFLSDHTAELLNKTRLEMEMETIPEMPGLVEATIRCLSDEKINLDLETRKNLYEILEQVSIPESFTEEILQTMDKKGDLGNDLALKMYFDLRKNKPECEFLAAQKERRRVLLKILSGTPQEIFDDFPKITRLANCLVVGVDMDNLTEGKVGIEMEYKPDMNKTPNGNISNRFIAGTDAGGVIEIRTNDEKLSFDEDYMKSLYQLETWVRDQPKEKVVTLHVHLDNIVHPEVRELMKGMLYEIRNGDNEDTEIWGMGFPSSASGLVNFMNFLAIGSKESVRTSQTINISEADTINWNNLLGGYFCSRLLDPESRLASIMAMRGEKKSYLFNPLELFNPQEILQSINFGDIKDIDQLRTGLNNKQNSFFGVCERAIKSSERGDLSMQEKINLQYVKLLGDSDFKTRDNAANMLRKQNNLSDESLDMVVKFLSDDNGNIRQNASWILEKQTNLSDRSFERVMEIFDTGDDSEKYYVKRVLRFQNNLSQKKIDKVVEMFGDSDKQIRNHSYEILEIQNNLSEETIDKLLDIFIGSDKNNRNNVFGILEKHTNLSQKNLDRVVEMLGDESVKEKASIFGVLRGQTNLSEKNIDKITEMLIEGDEAIKTNVLFVLRKQKSLSEESLDKVIEMFEDDEKGVITLAFKVLEKQTNLPEKIINKVLEKFGDIDDTVREYAVGVFRGQTNLHEGTIDKVVDMLGDSWEGVRVSALGVLEKQTNLPENIVDRVLEMFGDSKDYVRESAIGVLSSQKNLSENTVGKLVEMMCGDDESGNGGAYNLLWRMTNLQERFIDRLTDVLEGNNEDIKYYARKVLERQDNFPEKTIERLTEMLGDSDDKNENIFRILWDQQNLPEKTIDKMMEMLGDSDEDISEDAISVLWGQSKLPEKTIERLTEMLSDNDEKIKSVAIRALGNQQNLPEKTIDKVMEMLGDDDPSIGENAITVLTKQVDLHDKYRKTIKKLIREKKVRVTRGLILLCIGTAE